MINTAHTSIVGIAHRSSPATPAASRPGEGVQGGDATEFARFLADVLTKIDETTAGARHQGGHQAGPVTEGGRPPAPAPGAVTTDKAR